MLSVETMEALLQSTGGQDMHRTMELIIKYSGKEERAKAIAGEPNKLERDMVRCIEKLDQWKSVLDAVRQEAMQLAQERVTDYTILHGNAPGFLEGDVNEAIKEGWELWGSPILSGEVYSQAMIRRGTVATVYDH